MNKEVMIRLGQNVKQHGLQVEIKHHYFHPVSMIFKAMLTTPNDSGPEDFLLDM